MMRVDRLSFSKFLRNMCMNKLFWFLFIDILRQFYDEVLGVLGCQTPYFPTIVLKRHVFLQGAGDYEGQLIDQRVNGI